MDIFTESHSYSKTKKNGYQIYVHYTTRSTQGKRKEWEIEKLAKDDKMWHKRPFQTKGIEKRNPHPHKDDEKRERKKGRGGKGREGKEGVIFNEDLCVSPSNAYWSQEWE